MTPCVRYFLFHSCTVIIAVVKRLCVPHNNNRGAARIYRVNRRLHGTNFKERGGVARARGSGNMCVCIYMCVRACVRARVRACACVCVRVCVRAYIDCALLAFIPFARSTPPRSHRGLVAGGRHCNLLLAVTSTLRARCCCRLLLLYNDDGGGGGGFSAPTTRRAPARRNRAHALATATPYRQHSRPVRSAFAAHRALCAWTRLCCRRRFCAVTFRTSVRSTRKTDFHGTL